MQNEMKFEMRADMLEPERESMQIFVDLRERECADIRGPDRERESVQICLSLNKYINLYIFLLYFRLCFCLNFHFLLYLNL